MITWFDALLVTLWAVITALGARRGLALGGLLTATVALGFPLDVRVTPSGTTGVYPSVNMPPVLYRAVSNSAIQNGLRGVWGGNLALRTLLIPDQTRRQ